MKHGQKYLREHKRRVREREEKRMNKNSETKRGEKTS